MFRCERCGSSYNALRSVGIENCPRCQARDRKRVPLTFKAFERQGEAKEPEGERSRSVA
jgi:predicted  nucleic acid-binding Zn-ribbon protein